MQESKANNRLQGGREKAEKLSQRACSNLFTINQIYTEEKSEIEASALLSTCSHFVAKLQVFA